MIKLFSKVQRAITGVTKPVLDNPGLFITVAFVLSMPLATRFLFQLGLIDFCCRSIHSDAVGISCIPVILIVAYVLCVIQQYLKFGKYLVAILALLVACDIFLAINFGMGISQMSMALLLQTNAGESREFIDTYLLSARNVILFLTIILICLAGLSKWFDKKMKAVHKYRPVYSYLILATVLLPVWYFLPQVKATARLCVFWGSAFSPNALLRDIPSDVLTKSIFSYKSVMATENDIEVMRSTTRNVNVDTCNFSSPNIIVVIGESFSKHHSSLYGYSLNTNPRLEERKTQGELFVFTDAVTPFNFTSETVKYVFSSERARQENNWAKQPLFPTVFKKAGYKVTLMENQVVSKTDCSAWDFMMSYFMYDPVVLQESFDTYNPKTFAYDGQLLDYFISQDKNAANASDSNNLVIFHLMGQHVKYAGRYPHGEGHSHFTANDIPRQDLSVKDRSVIADYDNATRYNDEIIDRICSYYEDKDAIVVYLSDHGDEVNDYRLHVGRSYSRPVTPGEAWTQYEIPMMMWCSDLYRKNHPEIVERIATSVDKPFMSDDLPQVLYDLAGITTSAFIPEHSILNPSYKLEKRPLLQSEDMIYEEIISKSTFKNH